MTTADHPDQSAADRADAETPEESRRPRGGRLSRRRILFGGAAAGAGTALALGADALIRRGSGSGGSDEGGMTAAGEPGLGDGPLAIGTDTVPFYGEHQAGITAAAQAFSVCLGLDLAEDADAGRLRSLMRILTDDAARLCEGRPALADTEPELATVPARLTVTFGFGPGFVERAGGERPEWLRPLEAFSVDALEDAWSGGDLLIQVAADDQFTVAHAVRMLLKDSRSFASLRWRQDGFRRARGSEKEGTTMRNLFGQVDGTVNPHPDDADFADLVWSREGWLAGGTSMVLRRIRMDLEGWDRLDRPGREQSIGRTLDTGAPLTGTHEHDEPDFEAKTSVGFPVIADFAHMRRARSENPDERIYRRSYNYDSAPTGEGISDSGLLFVSYQADVTKQFAPIQRRLDELDLLNEWTTPIGSAVFAIPPGCEKGGFIGETLL